MTIEALAAETGKFVKSSAYQFGDRTGFSINLHERITLPGRCSPGAYLDALGLDKLPKKVMVVCAGNGGLAVECFARGAKQVIALEARPRYTQGLQGVQRLLEKLWRLQDKHDCDLIWLPRWPKTGRDQGVTDCDLILWANTASNGAVSARLLPNGEFHTSLPGNTEITDALLRNHVASTGEEVAYTCASPVSGVRLSGVP